MDALLQCRCGEVHGRVTNASRERSNHAVCYCDDCQAYLHHLGRPDLLDAHGGTEIVQVAPAALSFPRGGEHIVGLRLTPKGLHRWYASCCNTPVGNTLGPSIPFVGIVAQAFTAVGNAPNEVFGPSMGGVLTRFALAGGPPQSKLKELGIALRGIRTLLGFRLGGHAWPNPFFDRDTRAPIRPITVLSAAQREALRPLCGPTPVPGTTPRAA